MRKQTNASHFETIRAAVHVIWHACAILPSSGAARSLVATLAWLFVCEVAQSSDVLCVADTCRDVDIAEVVLLWRRHHCVMTCCDVHACGYVCLNVWLPLHFFWFQWFMFVLFCEVIILPNMLRSTVAMLLFSTQLSFPEPCRLLCAAFYGCSCFCLCLNNVVTITHGMVVFFIVNTSSIPALWCQCFLSSMDAVVCPMFKKCSEQSHGFNDFFIYTRFAKSMPSFLGLKQVQAMSLISHMVWSWFWWNIFLSFSALYSWNDFFYGCNISSLV